MSAIGSFSAIAVRMFTASGGFVPTLAGSPSGLNGQLHALRHRDESMLRDAALKLDRLDEADESAFRKVVSLQTADWQSRLGKADWGQKQIGVRTLDS